MFAEGLPEKRKRITWTANDTKILLGVWKRHIYVIRNSRRNTEVFLLMKKELESQNVKKSIAEIKSKVKNLTTLYR